MSNLPADFGSDPERDDLGGFFFSGVRNGWFSRYFYDDYSLLGYVGARPQLTAWQKRGGLLRAIAEIGAKNINIASIVQMLTGFPLLGGADRKEGKTVAEQIIVALGREEHKKTLHQFLKREQKRAVSENPSKNRSFDGLKIYSVSKPWPWGAESRLEGLLVVVQGHLLHRDSVAAYSGETAETLSHSSGYWLLSDVPPHGMDRRNKQYKGQLVLLREDSGFTDAYGALLPFWVGAGWYPYVRVTGFADVSKMQAESYPTVCMALVEYRRPRPWLEVGSDAIDFLRGELAKPNYLADQPDLITGAYLVPLITCGSLISGATLQQEEKLVLHGIRSKIEELPSHGLPFPGGLKSWYDKL